MNSFALGMVAGSLVLAMAGAADRAAAQNQPKGHAGAESSAAPYHAPRTEFGDPDLQGLWTNASITTLERPPWATKLVLTPEEAAVAVAKYQAWLADNDKVGAAPPTDRDDVGGYNSFWLDPGSKFGVVRGEIRTSWIVDPPNGHIPYSPGGRACRDGHRVAAGPRLQRPGGALSG